MDLQAYNEAFDVHDLTRPEDVLHYLEGKSQLQLEEGEQFISTELVNKVRGYFHGMFFFFFFFYQMLRDFLHVGSSDKRATS